MKLGNIDIELAFRQFWAKPQKIKILSIWIIISFIVFVVFSNLPIAGILAMLMKSTFVFGAVFTTISFMLLIIVSFIISFYATGSEFENHKIFKNDLESTKPYDSDSDLVGKLMNGFKITMMQIIYSLPVILAIGISVGIIVISLVLVESIGSAISMLLLSIGVLLLILSIMIATIYQIIVSFAFKPLFFEIAESDGFAKLLNVQYVWNEFKKNWRDLMMTGLILYMINFVIMSVFMFLSNIPCLGQFIVPIILGLYYAEIIYVESHIIAQYTRHKSTS